ncbi:MAG: asparagine synthase (glutamine-hydrolyzing) [Proteobacteria bacterium]|nr:asparagine synthase (glutamine-hydrolyzing) [Pseudomonadota bacterium]
MCGVFGWAVSERLAQSCEELARLTDLLRHRGPDGSGYDLERTRDGKFQIGLGHRRLSIIDIEGGIQPMWDAGRNVALIFNGEIYNYIELREELRTLGHRFRTQSDTEVLTAAYLQWGLEALKRLRGMFAFALWDTRTEILLLARDQFGKKPLFLASSPGRLAFASEIEPLTRTPGVDVSLDPSALDHYLLNRYVPGPLTFFKGIVKLQPGSYGLWKDGRLSIERYYTPPFATIVPDVDRLDEAVELFRRDFDESVHIRMRSDAPYGAYLSGGIDSSAVVAAMVRHCSGKVRTFSVGFDEAAYSELGYARTVSNFFGTDHHELTVTSKDFFDNWSQAVQRRGAPVSEASDIPIMLLSRMASRTVKMVLTGEGSDELLGGYPKHRAEPWIEIYQRLIPGFVHRAIVSPALRILPYRLRRVKIAGAAAGERDLTNRMRIWFGDMSRADRDTILGRPASTEPPDGFPFSAALGSTTRRTLFFDQTSWLPDNLLERGDRMTMAASIEGRMPFMDTALAATVARFSDRFLIGRPGGKAVLRETMMSVLPAAILNRPKVGFRVPFSEWFRGEYAPLVRDLLTSDASSLRQICSRPQLELLVADHIEGRRNNEKVLWSLMNLEMFLRLYRPQGARELCLDAA